MGAPVIGEVLCLSSHLEMLTLSYVYPSHAITGSTITSRVIEQKNSAGIGSPETPALACATRIFITEACIIGLGCGSVWGEWSVTSLGAT